MDNFMIIPLTVSPEKQDLYKKNMAIVTNNFTKTILFAYDHRIEHLQYDFYGENVSSDASLVEHAFTIATKSKITAFATHLGLISRYAEHFPNIPYVVKLTGKIPIRTFTNDAYNYPLWSIYDVIDLQKRTTLCISGIAVTVYLGSIYEPQMLQVAAEYIDIAQYHGLVTFLFMYLRNKEIKQDDIMLLAGAAGVANSLGADFVKLHVPDNIAVHDAEKIRRAAGNTNILFAGGEKVDQKALLGRMTYQFQNNMCDGVAIGRNLFKRSVSEGTKLVDEIIEIRNIK